MNIITESLHAGDLRFMVKKVFGIDSYASKIGDDEDIVVLSFTVDEEDPAKDLENFIEMGYSFVLDADVTPGETDDGSYQVFVELERNHKVAKQVMEIIDGVKLLADFEDMRFRYFKNFKSEPATLENLYAAIPKDRNAYTVATERNKLDNFQEFFKRSYADKITVLDESISFKKKYKEGITFDIITSGTREDVYNVTSGPIMLEGNSIAETMFLTKIIGDYNITKIGDTFIFENNGWAVALKRKH